MQKIHIGSLRAVVKKIVYWITILGIVSFSIPLVSFAQNINTPENFPDPIFRKLTETFMGVKAGGIYSASQAAEKTGILMGNKTGISNLKGIEFFLNIREIHCSENHLQHLDLTKNRALVELHCANNRLTELDCSQNPALRNLNCHSNQIQQLDVSNHLALEHLRCSYNQIKQLDISNNPSLKTVECDHNRIERLDFTQSSRLDCLICSANPLLDLRVNTSTPMSFERRDNLLDRRDYVNKEGLSWPESESLPVWIYKHPAKASFDGSYLFSSDMNPFYQRGDFNGDGLADLAILIKEKTTKKIGIAIFHQMRNELFIVGAGQKLGNGGDNYSWMDAWDVYDKGIVYHGMVEEEEAPPTLIGDAIDVAETESANALIYWDGKQYQWYQQGD